MAQESNNTLANMGTITPEAIIAIAERKGKLFNEKRIKTNQIRNFYSEITAMKLIAEQNRDDRGKPQYEAVRRNLILLKPKLAYAAGRQPNVREVYTFISEAIQGIDAADDNDKGQAVENFFDLIESVVAYHKFYGDN